MEVGLKPSTQTTLCEMGPSPPRQKEGGAPSPIFGPFLLCPIGWMHQDATWYGGRPQPRRLRVRLGPHSPPQKGGGAPKVSTHVYCGQTAGWIKMVLVTEVCLCPGVCVRWVPARLCKKGAEPQFSAHVYCGQTAAWIKMPLGTTDVGLGPDDIVSDGDPVPLPKKGAEPPIFGPCLLWPLAKRLDG